MKIKILLALIIFATQNFAQSKRVADRYYHEFSYVRAAKLYEAIYQKGDSSAYILKRLGDSYYKNAETEKAEFWYNKLTKNFKNTETDYLFKYAQVLRSNGKYQKSDSLFLVLAAEDKMSSLKEEIENESYFIDYSNTKEKRISIRNLAINTPYSDFGGFIINSDETYFASAAPKDSRKQKLYRWNNQPFLNIYMANNYIMPLEESERDSVLELEYKTLIPPPVNTQYHESTPVFTKDGKTMYFTRVNFDGKKLKSDKGETINLKLYKAKYYKGNWLDVTELPFNNNDYSIGHPALSIDEKTLYFVSDMPGGFGETDIYKVNITEDGYSEPVNLGSTVNTKGKEMFPFVGEDNTLYFSSNGHIGLGLLDIFQTKILENNTYSKAVNLGYPFNSKKDDFSFYLDKSSRKGFFSSNRDKGKGDDDIYSFIIYDDPKPEICFQTITGIIRSKHDNSPIAFAKVKLIDSKGEVVKEVVSSEDGSYKLEEVPCGDRKYVVHSSKLDFKSNSNNITTTMKKGKVIDVDLTLAPLIIGNQIVINSIYFDFNESDIREDAEYELENIVIVMNNHPDMIIKIESHTDSRGEKEYNRKLSDRRAKSTRDFIISRGITPDRIESAIGYGEDQLLNNCDDANRKKCTEEEHQLNRRSYFYIVKGGSGVDIENKK
ncbi:WD40 repeat protein [Tenacibaculum adriaticum]|uniref:WD40 repeat protein n=1 Tax=Tenacibaculum adriaticum TaxID=413713 RepID=A0A5S5DLZ5_9FLAO|nr:OmpA family protein [Tenacibaculum adriaticum]TYP96066.1 WD40 repeat protein [Tenacibaculum adriaticum]